MTKNTDPAGLTEPARPPIDSFLAAVAAAEEDDEPYTDEQRAAAQTGREEFARGKYATLDDVWRDLIDQDASAVSES